MNKAMMGLVALTLCGCASIETVKPIATVASPDGSNEIRLYTEPLSYEVLRNGAVLVKRSEIGLKVDGKSIAEGATLIKVKLDYERKYIPARVYKKSYVCMNQDSAYADFGDWGVRIVARNDGVAYRFELRRKDEVTVDCEKMELNLDSRLKTLAYHTDRFGCEEVMPKSGSVGEITTEGKDMVYLPLVVSKGKTTFAVSDTDVRDYPTMYLKKDVSGKLRGEFAKWPKRVYRAGGWDWKKPIEKRGRWEVVAETEDYLVKTKGKRTLPWRTFSIASNPSGLVECDINWALAKPAKGPFGWVKPGKVAWDWWNAFDNLGESGCNTKVYERFIDFAAKHKVEYVIFDEGWSETLNIWKYSKNVDVPHLVEYGKERGVGIILWMAWGQIVGEEAKVAEEFAKLGVKGFKVDFMDRGDAQVERFMWKFAEECAKQKLLIAYHGVHHPNGLQRTFENVVNYEAIHGLEQMKFFCGQNMVFNDVAAVFGRLSAGPMDYTPGAMDNYELGTYPASDGFTEDSVNDKFYINPGSLGTRAHQMAMMVAYEAPLQMLSDSPTKYEQNAECFKFMAKTPVVWANAKGLGGGPESYVALARRAREKRPTWYVGVINGDKGRTIELDLSFLSYGKWRLEYFADVKNGKPTEYEHKTITINHSEKPKIYLAPGGGYVAKLTKVKWEGNKK